MSVAYESDHTDAERHDAPRKPLGALLVAAGFIDEAQLNEALNEGTQTGERLGEVVVRRGWASEDDVAKQLAEQWELDYVDRASIWFDADALSRLSREDAQHLEALPIRVEGDRVMVAVAEPTEQRLAALRRRIGDDTVVVVVPRTALDAGIRSELLTSRAHPAQRPRAHDDAAADTPAPEVPAPARQVPAPPQSRAAEGTAEPPRLEEPAREAVTVEPPATTPLLRSARVVEPGG